MSRIIHRNGEWQPIETAPRVANVIGYDPRWGVCEVRCSDQMGYWALATFNGQHIKAAPTHWMPLPEPPGETA